MIPDLCVVRGGGDLATGVIWRLTRAGWPVIVCELGKPLTVRRTVSVSSAVREGTADVQGMVSRRCESPTAALDVSSQGEVAVLVAPGLPDVVADVVIDARLAKRNIDTTIHDAPLVVALGPGFETGVDCHAIVETKRGHDLGRVLWSGSAAPNTGTPGVVGGKGSERVIRAPSDGVVRWSASIGDLVGAEDLLGAVGDHELRAPFDGVVRGLIADGQKVGAGLKIGDIDPRSDRAACFSISDKALAVGGGVVEAILTWPTGADSSNNNAG